MSNPLNKERKKQEAIEVSMRVFCFSFQIRESFNFFLVERIVILISVKITSRYLLNKRQKSFVLFQKKKELHEVKCPTESNRKTRWLSELW